MARFLDDQTGRFSGQRPGWNLTPDTWRGENTHSGALNFYPIFIPLLRLRFQVSVFRICHFAYLSWHLTPETKFAEQKRFKKLSLCTSSYRWIFITPPYTYINHRRACCPSVATFSERSLGKSLFPYIPIVWLNVSLYLSIVKESDFDSVTHFLF